MDEDAEQCDLFSDNQKPILTDSLFNCVEILKSCNFINDQHSENYASPESLTLGSYLAKIIIEVAKDMSFVEEEECFLEEENVEEVFSEENLPHTSNLPESQQSISSKKK